MASTNKTSMLNLNQWLATDKPVMADFNADNLNISNYLLNLRNSRARAFLSASNQLDLVSGTITKVVLDGETYDPGNNFDTTSTYRFVAPITGYYFVNGQVMFTSIVASKLYAGSIYINGVAAADVYSHSSLTSSLSCNPSGIYYLTSGQYVELYATSYSGDNTVDIIKGSRYTFLEVALLST